MAAERIRLKRWDYNHGIERELKRDRTVEAAEDKAADRIMAAARAVAPVRTGRYRSSITKHRDGEAVTVTAAVPYGAYVEWGTRDTPTFHPLAKGLAAVVGIGGRL